MGFIFQIGQAYKTQRGEFVRVEARTIRKGYECLLCRDNLARYDRSTDSIDAGRVTGSPHDYSHPDNFVHPPEKGVDVRPNSDTLIT